MKNFVEARSPGKIYIAGEYAVVVGGSSIIFPVDKYVTVKLKFSDKNYICSHKYHNCFIELDFNNYDDQTKYIVKTISWFNNYMKEINKEPKKYKIEISSELDSNDNKKYGFGSSGAIIIALLKALFKINLLEYSKVLLYKCAVMIQNNISKFTSFGDLACIALENKIYYKKFNDSLLDEMNKRSITEMLSMNWDGLIIEPINFNHKFLIVHTNVIANSYDLVNKVIKFKDDQRFLDFASKSEDLVIKFRNAKDNYLDIINDLDDNLLFLDSFTKASLNIENMDLIRDIIFKNNGAMKFSGAGGGDSVICFFNSDKSLEQAMDDLLKFGFGLMVYEI